MRYYKSKTRYRAGRS